VTYKSTTVTAGLQSLSSGQLDMVASGLGVTTERQQVVSFGKGLYWSTTAVVTKKGAGSADLGGYSGKKVGVVTGAVQEKFVTDKMKGAVKTNFQALGAAVSQLNSGTVDAAVMGGPDAEEYLKQFPDLEIAASAPVDHETTVAFQKSNDALVKAWDKTVTDMVNDGTLKKMYNTYFTEAPNAQLLKIWPGLK
jgi:ABC-type amino acid transport substrate-binding protein